MNAEIKVLHVQIKTTRDGKQYKVVHVLVTIEGTEWVRKFYLFQ